MDLSIYFVIGSPSDEFFESSRIGGYFPISASLLLNSISRLFFDLQNENFQILCIGQEKDYSILKHFNNKAYCQFGNGQDDFYAISPDQNIQFKLFQKIDSLFDFLDLQIQKSHSKNILIILQDHETLYQINKYSHIKLLDSISSCDEKHYKNFLIYDDSCHLIDLFTKNKTLFSYFQKKKITNDLAQITKLYYFALFQSKIFDVFKDCNSKFFNEYITFISQLHNQFLSENIFKVIDEILDAYDRQNQNQEHKKDFSTEINKDFFDKLKNNSNFDISQYIEKNRNREFSDLDSFLKFLQSNNIKYLSNLLMLKSYYLFTNEPDKQFLKKFNFFSVDNFKFFYNVVKEIYDIPGENAPFKTIEELKQLYSNITDFFYQYFCNNYIFFDYHSNVEFVTSTNFDKLSLNYPLIIANSNTEVFLNNPAFAYFIKYAFFILKEKYYFDFVKFAKNIYCDKITLDNDENLTVNISKEPEKREMKSLTTQKSSKIHENQQQNNEMIPQKINENEMIPKKTNEKYFLSYEYKKFEKPTGKVKLIFSPPQHYIYPNEEKPTFEFRPSSSLPMRIAAARFLTHFVRDYLSKFQKLDYFPKLNFSCGFSKIPSNLLINFISLSILPNTNSFDLKLNNVNFLKVLKFANSVFQTSSMNKQLKKTSINNNRFEFTVFFSVILSSKIRYFIAKNLLLILKKTSNFYDSLYLFSIKELEYAQEFLNLKNIVKCTEASHESTVLFLKELFSVNLIDQYYSFTPPDDDNAVNENSKDKKKSKEFKRLRELKKSPGFNLQKMFLDLESSILNILPSDAFVFSAIYSYLLLKYHNNLFENSSIQKDVETIQKNLLEEKEFNEIKEKLNAFNALTDILQYCNDSIFKCLQKTYNFLQFFYQSYYFVSFCKVSKQYKKPTKLFNDFLKQINKNIPSNLIQNFFDSLTLKLKPFPLFCLPFIFFDKYSYSSYKSNLVAFVKNFKSNEQIKKADCSQNKEKEEFNGIPDSSHLFESNYLYSEQFRIHLSNLSLYSDFKINVIENIDVLNRFINAESNDVSNFLSLPFFENPFPSPKFFEFDCQEIENNCQYTFQFCVDTILETYMKQSISDFIKEFVSTTTQFLHFDIENMIEKDYISCTDINDFQLFFCSDEESNVYINSLLNNLKDLINKLSISKPNLTYNSIVINEEMHDDLVNLVYSVLEAQFNNKVEIDPIVKLIPKYEKKFSDPIYWSDPTDREFMALCSAIQFTLCPTDKLKKIFYTKSSEIEKKEEVIDDEYSSSHEFDDDDNNQSIKDTKYETLVDDALDLSEEEIVDLREKYDVRHKEWTEIIWNIFYEYFNKKLKEININFDKNNNYSRGFACIHCLANENKVIMDHFPQLENMKDIHDKEVWIGRFIYLNKKYEYQIKSAYVYALLSSYSFLNIFYTFDDI